LYNSDTLPILLLVSGDANFHMDKTGLSLGGFTQPSVATSLIELPQSQEKGLVQRFLWILPTPTYGDFKTLQVADESFCEYLSKCCTCSIHIGCINKHTNKHTRHNFRYVHSPDILYIPGKNYNGCTNCCLHLHGQMFMSKATCI